MLGAFLDPQETAENKTGKVSACVEVTFYEKNNIKQINQPMNIYYGE